MPSTMKLAHSSSAAMFPDVVLVAASHESRYRWVDSRAPR
jgi:hypothetical protein